MTIIINIESPSTKEDNSKIISFITPLLDASRVTVNAVYWDNLHNHENNEYPVQRSGFKYYFWFEDEFLASEFKSKFFGEMVEQ